MAPEMPLAPQDEGQSCVGAVWPGQSLSPAGMQVQGHGKGLVSQEEGGGHQEILQIQNVRGAPRGRGA